MEVHVRQNKTECVLPAGYLNRKARRMLKKKGAHIWRIR